MKKILMTLAVLASISMNARAEETPKRVVVCSVTLGFRHGSIPFGEKAIQEIADATKAFTVVDWLRQPPEPTLKKPAEPKLPANANPKQLEEHSKKMQEYQAALAKWTPEEEARANEAKEEFQKQVVERIAKLHPDRLREQKIDAVIFVNTTGDLPLPDAEGFAQWIEGGGAFIGMHAASDTLKNCRPYMDMLQGCFAGHGPQVPAELIAGDCEHPANGGIGKTWNLAQEEIYHISQHDRAKVRSLWFMRHDPNKAEQAGYFPLSWARQAGKGRVFYTALGHREDLWEPAEDLKGRINPVETSKQYRAHITGGILWALGLVPGSAEPNPEIQ